MSDIYLCPTPTPNDIKLYDPTLGCGGTVITVSPGVGALTLLGFSPSLINQINAGFGALTLTGYAPTLINQINTDTGALILSGQTPTITGPGPAPTPTTIFRGFILRNLHGGVR